MSERDALQVIGAGLGRTGTHSLKIALERLLGGRCFHMVELFERPQDTAVWHDAARGEPVDWNALLADFTATVDWPACSFYAELLEANPDAIVLLSMRSTPEKWWESASETILPTLTGPLPEEPERAERRAMMLELMSARFTPDWRERAGAIAGYERHNDAVRRTVPAAQLVEWSPGDGWEPICSALGLEVPDEPFPLTNTRAEFQQRMRAADEER